MMLNASGITPPPAPEFAPYDFFTQENIFTKNILDIITPSDIAGVGIGFQNLSNLLSSFGEIDAQMTYASDVDLKTFRQNLIKLINTKDTYVIGFYDSMRLGLADTVLRARGYLVVSPPAV